MPATPKRCSLLRETAGPPPCGIHAGCAPAQLGALGSRFIGCACLAECNGLAGQMRRMGTQGLGFYVIPSFGGGVGEAAVPEEVLPTSSSLAPTFSFSYVSSLPFSTPGRNREGHSGSGVQKAGVQQLLVLKSQPQPARCWGKGEDGRAGQGRLV